MQFLPQSGQGKGRTRPHQHERSPRRRKFRGGRFTRRFIQQFAVPLGRSPEGTSHASERGQDTQSQPRPNQTLDRSRVACHGIRQANDEEEIFGESGSWFSFNRKTGRPSTHARISFSRAQRGFTESLRSSCNGSIPLVPYRSHCGTKTGSPLQH